jgi:Histone methylation protein DOT1
MITQMKVILLDEILTDIETIGDDERLLQEQTFSLRSQALDDIEFHIIDRIDALAERMGTADRLNHLRKYALKVRDQLEEVNAVMFRRIRMKILEERCRGKSLTDLIDEYFDESVNTRLRQDLTGYDSLDIFLDGVLTNQSPPAELQDREPGMIYYQKTPARIVLELVNKAAFKPQDVFFDLGSVLGQIPILVNLFSSVISKGVEFEPAFCHYAKSCADDLQLTDVEFINADARYADYSSGTVFFMYTPLEGKMLQQTLLNLKGEAKKRKIRIFTFGPCTYAVSNEDWLTGIYNVKTGSGEFAEFRSI